MSRYRRDRNPYREPPDDDCRCVHVDNKALLVDQDCPVHGDAEPPEPDPYHDQLELDLRDKGHIPF